MLVPRDVGNWKHCDSWTVLLGFVISWPLDPFWPVHLSFIFLVLCQEGKEILSPAEAAVWGLWVTGVPQHVTQRIDTHVLCMSRGWQLQVTSWAVSKQEPFKELSRNVFIYFLLQFLPTPTFPSFCLLLSDCVLKKDRGLEAKVLDTVCSWLWYWK